MEHDTIFNLGYCRDYQVCGENEGRHWIKRVSHFESMHEGPRYFSSQGQRPFSKEGAEMRASKRDVSTYGQASMHLFISRCQAIIDGDYRCVACTRSYSLHLSPAMIWHKSHFLIPGDTVHMPVLRKAGWCCNCGSQNTCRVSISNSPRAVMLGHLQEAAETKRDTEYSQTSGRNLPKGWSSTTQVQHA